MAVDRGLVEVTKALLDPCGEGGREGDKERFGRAVRQSVQILDNRGIGAISLACRPDRLKLLEILLSHGADPNVVDADGFLFFFFFFLCPLANIYSCFSL